MIYCMEDESGGAKVQCMSQAMCFVRLCAGNPLGYPLCNGLQKASNLNHGRGGPVRPWFYVRWAAKLQSCRPDLVAVGSVSADDHA